MPYGWEGEKVRLTPLDKAKHLDNALAWINDPEITAWTLMGDWPLTRLAEMADNPASLRMLERARYQEVGRIPRRLWKRGAYRDVVLLALERP